MVKSFYIFNIIFQGVWVEDAKIKERGKGTDKRVLFQNFMQYKANSIYILIFRLSIVY